MSNAKLIGYLRDRLRWYSQHMKAGVIREAMLDDADKPHSNALPKRRVTRLLKSGYTCESIAYEIGCGVTTVQVFKRNLKLKQSRERDAKST